jgi:hypothetical protein
MVFGRPEIVDFWGLGGHGGRETIALRAPPLGRGFPAAGAAQTPQIDDLRPAQSQALKTLVSVVAANVVV